MSGMSILDVGTDRAVGHNRVMARVRIQNPRRGSATDAVTDAVLTASRLLIAVSATSIAEVDESITIPQFRLLVVLHGSGKMKLTTMAELLGVKPSTATRMVDRLVAKGLVQRHDNPASRREILLDLTEVGAKTVVKVTRQRRRNISGIVARMPAGHRESMVRTLEAFNEAGGESPVRDGAADEWI